MVVRGHSDCEYIQIAFLGPVHILTQIHVTK